MEAKNWTEIPVAHGESVAVREDATQEGFAVLKLRADGDDVVRLSPAARRALADRLLQGL